VTKEQTIYDQLITANRQLVRLEADNNMLRGLLHECIPWVPTHSREGRLLSLHDRLRELATAQAIGTPRHASMSNPLRKPKMGEPGWSTATDAPDGAEG
jgi:hypothetical protein